MTYVHDAAVDVAELLEAEQSRPMCTVIEDKALSPRLKTIKSIDSRPRGRMKDVRWRYRWGRPGPWWQDLVLDCFDEVHHQSAPMVPAGGVEMAAILLQLELDSFIDSYPA